MVDGHVAWRFALETDLATVSLALVVVGGVFMVAYLPKPPPLALPMALVTISALLLRRDRPSSSAGAASPGQPSLWSSAGAFVAYVISAGMIEFSFVRNHVGSAPLLVVSLMLVLFAIDVPVIIAVTVARYQSSHPA